MFKSKADSPYMQTGKTADQDKRTEIAGYVTSTGAFRMLKEMLPGSELTQASVNYMIRKGKVASFELVASKDEGVSGVVLVEVNSLKEYAKDEGERLESEQKQKEEARIEKLVRAKLAEEMLEREKAIRAQILATHDSINPQVTKPTAE